MEVAAALSRVAGGPVTVLSSAPVSEGWSAAHGGAYPHVRRCAVAGPPAWDVTSVVVKLAVPREVAALRLLSSLGSDVAPAVLAVAGDVVVLEDLGSGPALEDLLVGPSAALATAGFRSFAAALGDLHAATRGLDGEIGTQLAGEPFATWWSRLGPVVAPLVTPPPDTDIPDWLAAPGPLVALSTGDVAPQNCRVYPTRTRLLDFARAQFQQAMLDLAQLRLPFYGGPCWSRVPPAVLTQLFQVYGERSPIDDASLAYAVTAWTVVRLTRLPKLLAADEPHPMGFSRRGQLLDTLSVAVESGGPLRDWFADLATVLRTRWPALPESQALYPAYRQDVTPDPAPASPH